MAILGYRNPKHCTKRVNLLQNIYDIERYERLRDLSAEMLAYKTAIPKETVKSLFCNEAGYQTPKIDSRAAIFKDDKILLVQENDGLWSLPGGWIDVLETIYSNTIKEVREEAGLNVKPTFIIAIHEQHKRNFPPLRILYSKPSSCANH